MHSGRIISPPSVTFTYIDLFDDRKKHLIGVKQLKTPSQHRPVNSRYLFHWVTKCVMKTKSTLTKEQSSRPTLTSMCPWNSSNDECMCLRWTNFVLPVGNYYSVPWDMFGFCVRNRLMMGWIGCWQGLCLSVKILDYD